MSDHIPDAAKMVCPFCAAEPKSNWGNQSVTFFTCGTMVVRYDIGREDQTEQCAKAERKRLISELTTLRTENVALVEELGRYKEELDRSAANLLQTINERNRIGVQLDLLRDELMRIRARIGETGLIPDHPELSSIAGYCERAQADIAVLYTPIEERDWLRVKYTTADSENAALVERVERLEEAGDAMLNAWLMPEDAMEYSDWVALSSDAKRKWYRAKATT